MSAATEVISEEVRREWWLEDRRKHLTGTEVPAILGLSPWIKPIDIWLGKQGERKDNPKPWQQAGKRFEQAILAELAAREGRQIEYADPYQLVLVPGFPLLGATLDATWADNGCPVDAKNIRYKDDDWGDDGSGDFPLYYRLQLHIQMMATETHEADLAVCFTGQDFFRYHMTRDLEIDAVVKEESRKWWDKHIVRGIAPEPDGSESFGDYLKQRFASSTDVLLEPTDRALSLIDTVRYHKKQVELHDAQVTQAEQELKTMMGEAAGIRGICTWKQNKPSDVTDWQTAFYELAQTAPEEDVADALKHNTKSKPGARVFRPTKEKK